MKKFKVYFIAVLIGFSGILSAQDNATAINISTDFLRLLYLEQYDEAVKRFDSVMAEQFPAKKLKDVMVQLHASVGDIDTVGESYIGKSTKGIIEVITPLFYKSIALDAKVYVKDSMITGFFMSRHVPTEYFIPEYADTSKFREIDLVVGENSELELKAKLTLPIGGGNFPCVVLVHGSGPNDMDETVGPNKPFKDIAYGLASRGIAVLRYDKRTKAHPSKWNDSLTLYDETVEDAVKAFELARDYPGIDKNRVVVLGHSLGAIAIPIIASETDAAGYIMAAGSPRKLYDLVYDQYHYLVLTDGSISKEEQELLDKYDQKLLNLKKVLQGEKIENDEGLPLNLSTEYWKYLNNYNTLEEAKKIKEPLLIIHNERDYQVTMKDYEIWKENISGDNITIRLLPELNHIFIEGEGKSSPQEYQSRGSVDEKVVFLIENWVKAL